MDLDPIRRSRVRRSTGSLMVALVFLAACGSDADEVTSGSGDTAPPTSDVTSGESTTTTSTTGDSSNSSATSSSEVTSTSATADADEVGLQAITSDLLVSEGVEAVGCWFYEGEGTEGDALFFSGYDGGFFRIDDDLVQVDKPDGNSFGVEQGLVYSNGDYEAEFTTLGEPVDTSIESTEQDATLRITPTDASGTEFAGTLWCGV